MEAPRSSAPTMANDFAETRSAAAAWPELDSVAAGSGVTVAVFPCGSSTMLSRATGSTIVTNIRGVAEAEEAISISERVRPSESRNILPRVTTGTLLPSGIILTVSRITSAENGAPAIERKLMPPESVLEKELLGLAAWAKARDVQSNRAEKTAARSIFICSPGSKRHCTLLLTRKSLKTAVVSAVFSPDFVLIGRP